LQSKARARPLIEIGRIKVRSRNYEHNRFDGIKIVKLENACHAQGFTQLWRSDNVLTEVEVMSRAALPGGASSFRHVLNVP
jgi:hypothetical protein